MAEIDIFVDYVIRSDSRFGPPFELVLNKATTDSETHYTVERLESFSFKEEDTANRAYQMCKTLLKYINEREG